MQSKYGLGMKVSRLCCLQDGVSPEMIKAALLEKRINVKTSPKSSTRMDFLKNTLPDAGVVRASVHYYNTEEEIRAFVEAVSTVA